MVVVLVVEIGSLRNSQNMATSGFVMAQITVLDRICPQTSGYKAHVSVLISELFAMIADITF